MSILLILILVSMGVAGGFVSAFIWAVRSGQYDDTYSPSVRVLFDERAPIPPAPVNGPEESPELR